MATVTYRTTNGAKGSFKVSAEEAERYAQNMQGAIPINQTLNLRYCQTNWWRRLLGMRRYVRVNNIEDIRVRW